MTAVAEANPTVARRKLAVYFQNLRKLRGQGLEELSDVLGVTLGQASRLDTGARGLRREDVVKLADKYGVDEADRARLLALADEARKRAWWQQYDLAPAFRTMIGMEQAALAVDEYAGAVVPGLLQTPDYARAVADAAAPGTINVPRQRIADAVEVRMRRQQILTRNEPPALWVVVDEAVLARVGGGPAVMRRQLEHLHAKAGDPNITLQVVGFEYGLYPAGYHSIILTMEQGLPDVLYTEDLQEPEDIADPEKVGEARRRWDILRAVALSPRESSERIRQYIDRLDP